MLMEVTGPEKGLQKLENLADDLDQNPDGYNQGNWSQCALGRYGFNNDDREVRQRFMFACLTGDPYKFASNEFSISQIDAVALFNGKASVDPLDAHETAGRIRALVMSKRQLAIAA